ncbi:hypothetical protein Phum_PHUM210090 [Pediculus humanus corporis]|uniref:Uncharacterized protein n=1 Tax=Pediculus humanus subsp. corporis TaxID=121224 RepID=E0VHH5_PEDHC|nr:uncharacterized protein Phum_PHUM210090 [Pediculus humanus corporis]EEB12831.1 hypothetical protein Phum_PHUM210090 [Pediculus humanus corporis]
MKGGVNSPVYVGQGAYGHHGPFAVSYRARVDAPRQDLLTFSTVPLDHLYHY